MSDLGQDIAALELKIMECEYAIEQANLAKKSIQLDRARINVKLANYEKSLIDIDLQIAGHKTNIESLKKVIQQKGETLNG